MSRAAFAVYDPPKKGLPYLAVMITEEGVSAMAFDTAAEAEAHNAQVVREMKGGA